MFLLRSKLDSKSSTFILLMGGGGKGGVEKLFFFTKKFQTYFSFSYLQVLGKAVHLRFKQMIFSPDMLCCTHQF